MNDHLYELVKKLEEDVSAARADSVITADEVFALALSIAKGVGHIIEAMGDEAGHKEDLIKSCEKIFDSYIEPLDIPRLHRIPEGWVDSYARSMISNSIEAAYDALGDD
tara:strand:+ start:5140 stop:5466 length:327 start_codon:yes stop_codon:yes gene_type:complete